ncbi:MAG: YceI family protein, partial [bacterium]|nr:YceI family protein [Candidatus Kapabacteria bacterium]
TIHFRSTSVDKTGEDTFRLHGDLTMRGVTNAIVLDGVYNGVQKSPWGTTSAGFDANGKINRKDWGLVWNGALETGGVLVGEEVKISLSVELVKQEVPQEVPQVVTQDADAVAA